MRADIRIACLSVARLLTMLVIVFAPAAYARDFPQDAMRGAVKAFAYPQLRIGDLTYHMTPASKIRDRHNRIIMPGAMPNEAEVMFNLDINGHIRSIWLLTPEEVGKLGPAASKPSAPR